MDWSPSHEDPRGRRARRKIVVEEGAARLENPEVLTQHEDGVAWLAVLGTGTWGHGHDTGERVIDRWGKEKPVVVMWDFPAGLHWVCQETVDYARGSGIPTLVVMEQMPDVVRRRIEGPLSPAHLESPSDGALVLVPEALETATDSVEGDADVALDFPCGYCTLRLSSAAARARHVEFEHEQDVRSEIDAQPEPEPVEPALTDA